jgi:apolipoprotein D and lipocalin family protein
MILRLATAVLALFAFAVSAPALAAPPPPPTQHLDITTMMGRWYEVARLPNQIQKGCNAGTSTWTRNGPNFAVVQACMKGALDGPLTEWKARAEVADQATNAKFKMSFFGGLVNQEYWVLENRPEQGWLILSTANGKYLWLMSTKPTLPASAKAQAVARIQQLGFDVGRLEFPLPAKG